MPAHTCGCREDVPLSAFGAHQVEKIGRWAQDKHLSAVFSSPLRRAVETARSLGLPVRPDPELVELNTGAWTGLRFDVIQAKYPAAYAARGTHLGSIAPPGGESFQEAGARMNRCMERILAASAGTIAVVAHGGIQRGWLCQILKWDPDMVGTLRQPWGGITTLETDGAGEWELLSLGLAPEGCPDAVEEDYLLEQCHTPPPVIAHGRAVADRAAELARETDIPVDLPRLLSACRLHDLLREKPDHARAGGEFLDRAGYPLLGEMISAHHDLPENAGPEAKLLYLADKLVQGVVRVPLETRFQASRKKCHTPEAIAAWMRRYGAARAVIREFHLEEETICPR